MYEKDTLLESNNPNSTLIFYTLINLSFQKVLYHQMVTRLKYTSTCILQDTGSSPSLLLRDVIPLTEKTFMGSDALIQGFECNFLNISLHVVNLKSDFVNGPVTVELCILCLLLVFICCLVTTLLDIRLWLIHL